MFKLYSSGRGPDAVVPLPDHLKNWHLWSRPVTTLRWSEKGSLIQIKERRVPQGQLILSEVRPNESDKISIRGYEYPKPQYYLIHISYWSVYKGELPSNNMNDWISPENTKEVYEFLTIAEAFAFLALFTADKLLSAEK